MTLDTFLHYVIVFLVIIFIIAIIVIPIISFWDFIRQWRIKKRGISFINNMKGGFKDESDEKKYGSEISGEIRRESPSNFTPTRDNREQINKREQWLERAVKPQPKSDIQGLTSRSSTQDRRRYKLSK